MRTRRFLTIPAAAGIGLGVGVAVLLTVHGVGDAPFRALGVSTPGVGVRAATALLRVLALLAAGVTTGGLVAAVGVLPSRGARLSPDGYAAVRRAALAAWSWAVAAVLLAGATVVVGTGGDLRVLSRPDAFLGSAAALEEPVGWLVAALAATVVAVLCTVTFSWRTAVGALAPAALAVVAPVVTGPVASLGAGHDIATDAAVLAALALAVWLGAAFAAGMHLARARPHAAVVRRRIRRLGVTCGAVALGGLGVAGASLVRAGWASPYGVLVAAQVALVAVAVTARGRVTTALLGAATVLTGLLAVALPPGLLRPASAQETLLGFDLPGPPTLVGLLGPGRVNVLLDLGALALAALYVAGVLRLRRRGDAWPPGRTAAWLGGCALCVWTTASGFGEYSMAMFSVHMGAHMLLSMLVPILLVLGGPVTLALRALPARPGGRDEPDGPREWLLVLLGSPVARLLTHPVVSLAVFVGSFPALYFSPLYAAALPYHWAHQLMYLHFLASGTLFFWPIVGVDRAPRPLPHVARLAILLASMPFHAFFGVALLGADTVIGERFYGDLALSWVPDLLADQSLGGGIAWAAGEGPLVVVVVALLVQWSRHDRVEARRHDRRADRDGDADLAAYNAMLADLARGRR